MWLAAVLLLLGLGLLLVGGCAGLAQVAQVVQPPRFEQDARPAEIRFITPSLSNPAGGAGVTLWLRVTNPNPFGFTLSTLSTTLMLEGSRAATGDFPLGLPLTAGQASVVPVDLSISFADVPGLANVFRQVTSGSAVEYQLDGTVGIDAGRFGQPTFGPMPLTSGEIGVTIAR
jgi:hypothetical protein